MAYERKGRFQGQRTATLEAAARAVAARPRQEAVKFARNFDYDTERNALIPAAEADAALYAGPYPGKNLPTRDAEFDPGWAARWNRAFHGSMDLRWKSHVAQIREHGKCLCH